MEIISSPLGKAGYRLDNNDEHSQNFCFSSVKHQFWLKKLVFSVLELQPAAGYQNTKNLLFCMGDGGTPSGSGGTNMDPLPTPHCLPVLIVRVASRAFLPAVQILPE
jgi:hypothetical protein